MTSETDDEKFIAWAQKKVGIYLTDTDEDRLFALARRGAAVQWRPISEAPKDGTHFLAVIKDERSIRMVAWCKTSHVPLYGWNLVDQGAEDVDFCTPTHFMPFPHPPAGETSDE